MAGRIARVCARQVFDAWLASSGTRMERAAACLAGLGELFDQGQGLENDWVRRYAGVGSFGHVSMPSMALGRKRGREEREKAHLHDKRGR